MIVQDWDGNEIKVGTKVVYGAPSSDQEIIDQTAEVIEISEPDVVYNPVTDADDGGYELTITIKFADGNTETLRAPFQSSSPGEEDVFVESGDLAVIVHGSR